MNMEQIISYRYRIYPDTKRKAAIDELIDLARQFYNRLLEMSIDAYKKDSRSSVSMALLNGFSRRIIEGDKRYLELYSQTRCEIEYRLLRAFQGFFRRCRERKQGKGVKAGFPRFKSAERYKSITYPQDNGSFSMARIKRFDRLRVSRIGSMKIELHRKTEGRIRTMTIKRNGDKYYAIFTAAREMTAQRAEDTNPVGIDMGLTNFIALSDGTKREKPQFMRKSHERISHWQRVVARRKKGSRNRGKAKARLENAYAKALMQNSDFLHRLTRELTRDNGYTSFTVESLSIAHMMLNHRLARSIANATWYRFQNTLEYKAESAGLGFFRLTEGETRNTTQECSRCGSVKTGESRLALGEGVYACAVCGLVIDRDVNAAKVILTRRWVREGHSRSNACRDRVPTLQETGAQTRSVNQEHTPAASSAEGSHGL